MSDLSEFSLIQHYFEQLTAKRDDVLLGIGDDCALLQCPEDEVLAVSIDTLVENVHFFSDVDPESLGHKSLAVGLSDLAAMGAKPKWFTLALTLPEVHEVWLKKFSQGLAKLANEFKVQLVGGDTTKGPLSISIQVHGFVDPEKALRRDGAQVGDLIYVTNTLGDAGAALKLAQSELVNESFDNEDKRYLTRRLECPTPRLNLGQKLIGIASAAIDISDGLVADLGHILEKSSVGSRIDLARLPLSASLLKLERAEAEHLALYSGDDYELCFTVPANHYTEIEDMFQGQCTRIGVITNDDGIVVIENDKLKSLKNKGYDHFSNS